MKSSTQDKIEGHGKEGLGQAKQNLGQVAGDKELQKEGRKDEMQGKIQSKTGDIKKVFNK